MSTSFRTTRSWAFELVFLLSGLAMGVSVQLHWFTNDKWYPHDSSLVDFAANGGWEEHGMTTRLLISPILMALTFLVVRVLTRALLFRILRLGSYKERYVRYDKLTYTVFLLSLLGLVGVYIDTGLLLVAFALLQLALIYRSGASPTSNTIVWGRNRLQLSAILSPKGVFRK